MHSVLAVKMQVQINTMGEGFAEALDRLVSGELAARQNFQDLFRRRDRDIDSVALELATSIENISSNTYNIFPVKQLVRTFKSLVISINEMVIKERQRRSHIATHQEIVGNEIIEYLTVEADGLENDKRESYLRTLMHFVATIEKEMNDIQMKEEKHIVMKETYAGGKDEDKKDEEERYHRDLMTSCKNLQLILGDLSDRLLDIRKKWPSLDKKLQKVYAHVADELLEHQWKKADNPPRPPRLFRGINPELANVLAGCLGMRSGITIDKDGFLVPKQAWDKSDPFNHLTDPGFGEELEGMDYATEDDEPSENKIEVKVEEVAPDASPEDAKNSEDSLIQIISGDDIGAEDRDKILEILANSKAELEASKDPLSDEPGSPPEPSEAEKALLKAKDEELRLREDEMKQKHELQLQEMEQKLKLEFEKKLQDALEAASKANEAKKKLNLIALSMKSNPSKANPLPAETDEERRQREQEEMDRLLREADAYQLSNEDSSNLANDLKNRKKNKIKKKRSRFRSCCRSARSHRR